MGEVAEIRATVTVSSVSPARFYFEHRHATWAHGPLVKDFPADVVGIVAWRTLAASTPDLVREIRAFRMHAPSRRSQARCPREGKLRSLPATDDRRATEGAKAQA